MRERDRMSPSLQNKHTHTPILCICVLYIYQYLSSKIYFCTFGAFFSVIYFVLGVFLYNGSDKCVMKNLTRVDSQWDWCHLLLGLLLKSSKLEEMTLFFISFSVFDAHQLFDFNKAPKLSSDLYIASNFHHFKIGFLLCFTYVIFDVDVDFSIYFRSTFIFRKKREKKTEIFS